MTTSASAQKSTRNVGERHYLARLTDHECDLICRMYEEEGFGYKALAKIFETPVRTIRSIISGSRRGRVRN